MFITNADASPASEIQDTTAAVTAVEAPVSDANAADSSTAGMTDANASAPTSLLDVLKDVVAKPKEEPEGSSTSEAGQEQSDANAEGQAEAGAEGDADLPFHTHPRWKQLNEERKALAAERDTLQEPAQRYQNITSFMDQHRLTPEEVAQGFEVMALLKSGKAEDLQRVMSEWMEPNYVRLQQQLGGILPEDLKSQVDDGLMSEDAARELARLRAKDALTAAQNTRQAEADEQSKAATAVQARAVEMATAVNGWEEQIKSSDPDYAKKAEFVEAKVLAIVQRTGKPPANAQEAVALAKQAYDEVSSSFKSLLPKPKPVVPTPTGMSARVTTAPQTLRQAVEAGLQRARA
jgi:hypothetical protein